MKKEYEEKQRKKKEKEAAEKKSDKEKDKHTDKDSKANDEKTEAEKTEAEKSGKPTESKSPEPEEEPREFELKRQVVSKALKAYITARSFSQTLQDVLPRTHQQEEKRRNRKAQQGEDARSQLFPLRPQGTALMEGVFKSTRGYASLDASMSNSY